MAVSQLIDRIRADIDNISYFKTQEWRKLNPDRRVMGCYPVYTPVELVHAAGMLPVLIAGVGEKVGMHQAGSVLQGFVCSIGRSTSELQIAGKLDFLDGMLFPSICEISRGLSGIMARHAEGKPFLYIHFPHNLDSTFASEFIVSELELVKAKLEELSGKKITSEAIKESFKIYNRRAELIDQLDLIRANHSSQLSASQFAVIRLAGMQISAEDHIVMLEDALRLIEPIPEPNPSKLRMVMTGTFCERMPIAILEAFEAEGVHIVKDDMLQGSRWWTKPLPLDGDPIKTLADFYINHSVVTSIVHRSDPRAVCNAALESMKDRNADGLIIATAKFCHPALSDATCLVDACESHGIPYIRLEFEESMKVFASIELQLEALMEARAKLPHAGTESVGVNS
jgi:benzoyl-CoA reductase subunit C